MNAYETAVAKGLTTAIVPGSDPERGYTPAEIVAILQTLTVSPISVAKAIHYFDQNNLGAIDPIENTWTGKLVDIARNENMPTELREGLRQLFRHLAKRDSEVVDTTDPTIAVQTANLLVVLVQLGAITTDERDAFYALDGGMPWLGLTVEQYKTQRVAAEDTAAKASIREATRESQQAIITPLQSKLNAIDAWLATDAALAMTPSEYQAYADSLLATDDGNPAGGE
jgi:hypothetical protein